MTKTIPSPNAVSRASAIDTFKIIRDVVLPTLGKGPLIRRKRVVGYAERHRLDDKAVERLKTMRRRYGPGPLVLPVPFRRQAVILSADDARMVLEHSPEPFTAASLEKRSALRHFEPDVVLASRGEERAKRRRLNEATLETSCPMHSLAGVFAEVVSQEMDLVASQALRSGTLDWDDFFEGWCRMVRRIVLGAEATEDAELTDLLEDLRYRANYAFLRPTKPHKREAFLRRVRHYVERRDPHSLVGRMAALCTDPDQQPHHQAPQYLFAFDPGAMASFRTLALLSTHPEAERRVLAEIGEASGQTAPHLEWMQACFLEALRLWPTTPAILRETTRTVAWKAGHIDQNRQVLIFAPFFHRDEERLEQAHTFDPSLWLGDVSRPDLALFPFSHGPVVCPAARLVPMVASFALRRLLTRMTLQLKDIERLSPGRLPGTLDNYSLTFAAAARISGQEGGPSSVLSSLAP